MKKTIETIMKLEVLELKLELDFFTIVQGNLRVTR